jgi:hypothetical protein
MEKGARNCAVQESVELARITIIEIRDKIGNYRVTETKPPRVQKLKALFAPTTSVPLYSLSA